MSAIETPTVTRAVELVLGGMSVSAAALEQKVARSTVKRALRRAGVAPKAHPSGPDHHAWKGIKPRTV